MADLCCEYLFGFSGDDRTLNEDGGNGPNSTLVPTTIEGLDGRPIRSTIVPRGGQDGGQKLESLFGPRLIVFSGTISIFDDAGVAVDPTKGGPILVDYVERLNQLTKGWEDSLEGQLNTDFALSYTPSGLAAVSLTVTYGFEGAHWKVEGTTYEPTFSFGLVCEVDP